MPFSKQRSPGKFKAREAGKNGGVVGQLVKSYGNIPDVLN
jgi:hypothetical protein